MDKITSSTVMPPTTLLPVDPKRSPAILVRLLLNRTWSTLSSRLRTMNRYRSKKFTFRATNVNLLHLMLIRRILMGIFGRWSLWTARWFEERNSQIRVSPQCSIRVQQRICNSWKRRNLLPQRQVEFDAYLWDNATHPETGQYSHGQKSNFRVGQSSQKWRVGAYNDQSVSDQWNCVHLVHHFNAVLNLLTGSQI